ncbi:MAG: helix-hairpin-helix domain-containing protein [Actinomycetota bacterium]
MDGGFREWIAGLGRREMMLLVVLGAGILAGAGLWFVRSLPKPITVERVGAGSQSPVPGPSVSPRASPIIVHVAGWVHRPGVYRLHLGDRVIDAIDRAGGPRVGADLDLLNLAALLVDAQQVYVPRRGESSSSSESGSGPGVTRKININVATAEELESLPGIGEVLAQRIIDYREENGPFASVDELVNVSGIGEATLEEIRDLVTV